jgi:hypothetical protein
LTALAITFAASAALFYLLLYPVEGEPGFVAKEARPTVACGSAVVGIFTDPSPSFGVGGRFATYCEELRQKRLALAGGVVLATGIGIFTALRPALVVRMREADARASPER